MVSIKKWGWNFIKYFKTLVNPGIEEVDYSNVVNVINLTEEFINESIRLIDTSLNVLKEKEIINFIDNVTSDFLKYLSLIKVSCLKEKEKEND